MIKKGRPSTKSADKSVVEQPRKTVNAKKPSALPIEETKN
jgi:hypothetical protein